MSMHTRKPYKLDYQTYLTWMREFVKWLTAHSGDADFPSHIVPDVSAFEALIDAFEAILGPYLNLIDLAHARNKLYTTAFENVYDKLKQIKWALPTVADDPDVLALFSLAGELPDDRDELYMTTQNALNYWATVSGDPLFAPMVADFTTLQTLFDDFIAARESYFNTDNDREARQNELLAAKEAIDEIERECFQWYNSRHPKGDDEWWTGTEWGTTSGGAEEPTGPVHPAAVANLTVGLNPFNHNILKWEYGEEALFDVFRAVVHPGDSPPVRPAGAYVSGVASPTFTDTNHPVNGIYVYWVCAVKDGVEGEFAEPVSIEREGEEPVPA